MAAPDGWAYQWACPLRSCTWTYEGTESELKAAFLGDQPNALRAFGQPGGQIHAHIYTAHRVEEWVQELVDLQAERAMYLPGSLRFVERADGAFVIYSVRGEVEG
jgi:hypothetical protein